jgi:hypothetical protein
MTRHRVLQVSPRLALPRFDRSLGSVHPIPCSAHSVVQVPSGASQHVSGYESFNLSSSLSANPNTTYQGPAGAYIG